MAKPISFKKLDVSLTADMAETTGQVTEETPFQILLLGDFSGRANRQINDPKTFSSPDYRPLSVDFEHVDQLMTRLNTQLVLPALNEESTTLSVVFQTLEDFHPDRLVRQGRGIAHPHEIAPTTKRSFYLCGGLG